MGRASASTKPTKAKAEAAAGVSHSRSIEAIGVVMLIGALFLCFALFSFDPGDLGGKRNLVGPIGVRMADALLAGIGLAGYLAAVVLVIAAGSVIVGRVMRPRLVAALSVPGIVLALTMLAHLLYGERVALGHPAGGAVGAVTTELLASGVGRPGAALVAVGLLLLGILGVSDLSLGAALRDGYRAGRWCVIHLLGWIEASRAASRAAVHRETELVEAERSRRAQAKLEAAENEHRLKEGLEEKKRVMVLKATAKAEERALAKIAALDVKERIAEERARAEAAARETASAEPEVGRVRPGDEDGESLGEDEARDLEAPIRLGIPGPGAEPKIVIQDAADPAQVLEQIDRQLGERDAGAFDRGGDAEGEAEGGGAVSIEGDASRSSGEPAGEGGIMIHERKHVEPDLAVLQGDLPLSPVEPKATKRIYQMPPINLLDYEGKPPEPIDGEALRGKATRLEEKLKTYGVEGRVTAIRPGPVVTTYEYQPAPGVKVAKIASLSDDIAMSMEAMRVRIVAPIPGRGVVGIELPNEVREAVYLKEMIAHDSFKKSKSLLTLSLGKDAEGEPQTRDLRSMPHILVAGTTGSGKSVSINTMILSILYKATPDQVKFIMVDPKMLELSLYEDIPHLLLPVVTDPRKASLALQWAVDEMERRYQMLSDLKVRDIDGFNRKLLRLREQREADAKIAVLSRVDDPASEDVDSISEGPAPAMGDEGAEGVEAFEGFEPSVRPEESLGDAASERPLIPASSSQDDHRLRDPWPKKDLPDALPYIVVLIDEFADLMCVAPRDVEASVQRLAQKARAAGIHVMLATQRPSTDVITGVIKNNFPSRISFRVASRHDSATILNAPGAENLLGMGDMLCLGVSSPSPTRIHGAYVSEEEVQRVVDFWKAQAKPSYDATILMKRDDDGGDGEEASFEHDEMYDRAVAIVTETRKASISAIQRRLRVGYNRAARMIEMMETEGIVGPASGPKGEREVLVRAMGADGPARS